jgi:hypothetical protein
MADGAERLCGAATNFSLRGWRSPPCNFRRSRRQIQYVSSGPENEALFNQTAVNRFASSNCRGKSSKPRYHATRPRMAASPVGHRLLRGECS